MSGGGNQPSRGLMSSKLASDAVRPEVLRNYERESEDADKQVQAALTEHRSAQEELDRIIKSGPSIDLTFEKLGMDIETGKMRITEAEKRLRALKSQIKPDDTHWLRFTGKLQSSKLLKNESEDKILQIG
ncbi:hypothetical protein MPER_00641, partial [Moniliophthora perniciosa FA553]